MKNNNNKKNFPKFIWLALALTGLYIIFIEHEPQNHQNAMKKIEKAKAFRKVAAQPRSYQNRTNFKKLPPSETRVEFNEKYEPTDTFVIQQDQELLISSKIYAISENHYQQSMGKKIKAQHGFIEFIPAQTTKALPVALNVTTETIGYLTGTIIIMCTDAEDLRYKLTLLNDDGVIVSSTDKDLNYIFAKAKDLDELKRLKKDFLKSQVEFIDYKLVPQ